MRNPLLSSSLLLLLAAAGAAAQADPATFAARDAHEGLLLAVDSYHDATRAKEKFGKKNPRDAGILAIEVFFRNDTDSAIRVAVERIRLILAPRDQARQRLESLALDEVLDRMLNKGGPNLNLPRKPLPGAPKPGRSKERRELQAALGPLVFEMYVLPPRSTARGFLFFDIARHFDWVSDAALYVPDLKRLPGREPLLFFEVALAPGARR